MTRFSVDADPFWDPAKALWEVAEGGPLVLSGTRCRGTGYFSYKHGSLAPPSVTLAVHPDRLTSACRAAGGLTVRPDGLVLVDQIVTQLLPRNDVAQVLHARLTR